MSRSPSKVSSPPLPPPTYSEATSLYLSPPPQSQGPPPPGSPASRPVGLPGSSFCYPASPRSQHAAYSGPTPLLPTATSQYAAFHEQELLHAADARAKWRFISAVLYGVAIWLFIGFTFGMLHGMHELRRKW
ncbi:hypothetical protein BD626DRAFT_153598 [Schizophyllum amplum]|uniref:Uncharacterized protein n=1 Tax=Schizophyllum amplum TaxID=97359 RepID=A0A550C3H4_9AGAR|nr:hypothetical protein BD626DRAFT_153598 [Auriculariopsis ampla]